jgi:hypothetical protein
MKKSILFLMLLVLLTSCHSKFKYNTGYFQDDVVNFSDVNSEYDDYNMADPDIHSYTLFNFSSNRKSKGGNFDIVGEGMYIIWSKTSGSLEIGTDLDATEFNYLIPFFDSVNTPCNELGPYALDYAERINNGEYAWNDLLLYANDCSGNFDIKFVHCVKTYSMDSEVVNIEPPQEIGFVNTGSNELYPSFYGAEFYNLDLWGQDPGKIEKMLFCSDRSGNYDIYMVNKPAGTDFIEFLEGKCIIEPGTLAITPFEWNSDSDDKCPYVNGKLLVFASNRPGGYGGFDLYYSRLNNGAWSEPVNFGDKINSAYDEYRPVTIYHEQFANSLIVFSSNRPGGKGGFDLYHVGIAQMIR